MYKQYLHDLRAGKVGRRDSASGTHGEGNSDSGKERSFRNTVSIERISTEETLVKVDINSGQGKRSLHSNCNDVLSVEELGRQIQDGSNVVNAEQRLGGQPRTSHHLHQSQTAFPPPFAATQEEVIRGNVAVECPSTAKIVRIFTSSTFTDTRHERNALMERVYPALKELCQQHGYEFQVVDMRWGIRDEATDDHMTTELCLREIDLCKKLSTGPYFVTFLSHKYGYRDFPNKIEATEFEKLYECIEDEVKQLVDIWFKRDENAVPPTYVLQPISSILPEFRAEDAEKRKEAKSVWYKQSTILQEAFVKAAKQTLDEKSAHRYLISVTEAEITRGVIESEDKAFNCLWFQRVINDIERQTPTYLLSRYKECNEGESNANESQDLLRVLRDRKLPKLLFPGRHKVYNVSWTENGIDPETSKEHKLYISRLCEEFKEELSKLATDAIELRKNSDLVNPLYWEIIEHTFFCQNKCKSFHGQQDTLDLVSKYLRDSSRTPFIIHGPSGCGKTSLVAMTAKIARKIFTERAGVVIRFIGTTPNSSNVGALLVSVISQMRRIYGNEETDFPTDIKELTEVFHDTLMFATKNEPLVLLLDSLDQLDASGGARQMSWLPKELPKNVKIILSTLPEDQYGCLPALEGLFQLKENFLAVPTLDNKDVDGILNKWLAVRKRSLTEKQRNVVVDAFQKCPLPLFLKLSFDKACQWTSYFSEAQTTLQTSVRDSINALYSRLEQLHGKILVSKALAYLTLSKSGLTESELEDILSCDDDVLNDVYMYWTPPVRRLPPLLLVRLKADLGQYLVDRGADGVKVFFWYHRQFIEAATDRYCTDPESNEKMHSALADFFAGTWANGEAKPYTDKKGIYGTADRKVTSQPVMFKTVYNLRKLNNLPHQRTEAKQLDLLKKECLLNFKFLQAKLHASNIRSILEDFLRARDKFPEDDQLKTVGECLQLSQNALITYPKELPSQLLGRIKYKQNMNDFLDDCMKADDWFFMPNKQILIPTGGQLLHCLADHEGHLSGLNMTKDSKYVVTSSCDESVKVWDTESGTLVTSIEEIGEEPGKILICCDESIFVVHSLGYLTGHKLKTGTTLYKIEFAECNIPFCVCGKDNNILCVFAPKSVKLYAADTGDLIQEVNCDKLKEDQFFVHYKPCCGSFRYAAAINNYHHIVIFDVETKQFLHNEAFPKFYDENGHKNQYTVDGFVFSPSGEHLYISNGYTNNIHVYNTKTMKEENMYPGEKTDGSPELKITPDGKTLYFTKIDMVVACDLESGQRSTMLQQPQNFEDAVMTDMTKAVTISADQVVRIWDLTKHVKKEGEGEHDNLYYLLADDEDDALKKAETIIKQKVESFKISYLKTLANPRYLLLKATWSVGYCIQIRDLELDMVVRHFKLDADPSKVLPLNDNKQIVIKVNRRVERVNLMSEDITTFQGKVDSKAELVLVRSEKEVATPTQGRRHIKIYDVITGKVLCVMKTDNKKKYGGIRTNDKGTIIAAWTEEGPCYVFDVVSRTCLYSTEIECSKCLYDLYVNDALITNDDVYLTLKASKVPAQGYGGVSSEYILFCWDNTKKCLHKELLDYEQKDNEFNHTNADDASTSTGYGVDSFKMLDDRTVVSNHSDAYIRVFDIISGEVKRKIDGHEIGELCTVPNGLYFLSHGAFNGDNSFELIDKTTFETLATFSPDYDIKEVSLTSDGSHVVGYFREYKHPVLWKIMGGSSHQSTHATKPLSNFPNIYGNETVKSKLTLISDNDGEDDPDSDVDEYDD